jgi:NAD(P)-dependent dehydrogenase (short-subunit alcohol dehydrogenase family)
VRELFDLSERVSVVTGGAKGIGMFYSEALAGLGSRVVVADIDAAAVKDTTSRLNEEFPGQILGADLDVTDQATIDAMIEAVRAKWNRIDVLVNNAALFAALPQHDDPWNIPDDEFDRVMSINVRGVYACTRASLPLMTGGRGRIINIASGLAFKGASMLMHYAASKAAVVNLTRSMAPALADRGITVNAIAPGSTDSPTVLEARAARAAASPDGAARPFGGDRRLGPSGALRSIDRTEVPEDLVGTLLYLASPASDFVTGQTIVVDGGTYFN